MYFVFLLLISINTLFAASFDPFLPLNPTDKKISVLDDHLIANLINPANGHLSIAKTDLVAHSVEPLSITRRYYPHRVKERYHRRKSMDYTISLTV